MSKKSEQGTYLSGTRANLVHRFDAVQGEYSQWNELKQHSSSLATTKTAGSSVILNYYRTNGLFKRIIDLVAIDSLRCGISISNDIDKRFENFLNQISFNKHFINAHKQARIFGKSLMFLIIDDGQYKESNGVKIIDNSTQVNFNNIKDVKIGYTFPADQFQPLTSENDGYPLNWEYYTISNPAGSGSVKTGETFRVHKSRTLLFTNELLFNDAHNLFNNNYNAVFFSVFEDISRLYDTFEMIVKLIEISQIDIVQFDLDQRLASGKWNMEELRKQIKLKVETMNNNKSLYNTVALDKQDDLKRIQSTLSGYDAIIDKISKQISSVTGISLPILFGEKSTGIANSGDKDLETYYNLIGSKQVEVLSEPIQQLLNLIAPILKLNNPVFKFNPLWQLSETEIVKNRHMQVQTYQICYEMGVLTTKEIRRLISSELSCSYEAEIEDDEVAEDDYNEDSFELITSKKKTLWGSIKDKVKSISK